MYFASFIYVHFECHYISCESRKGRDTGVATPHSKKKKKKKRIFRKKGKIEKECKLTSVKVECFDRVCTYE